MSRILFGVAFALAVGTAQADEIKGKITKVDAEKAALTVAVDGKDQTLPVDKEAKFLAPGKKKQLQDVTGGLGGLKEGDAVTVTAESKDGKETVTKVVVDGKTKKKKADK